MNRIITSQQDTNNADNAASHFQVGKLKIEEWVWLHWEKEERLLQSGRTTVTLIRQIERHDLWCDVRFYPQQHRV